jgi:hypothetical protein
MKKLFLVIMLVLGLFAFSGEVNAQAVSDNVSVQAGVGHVASGTNVAAGRIELTKVLTPKLVFDNTLTLTDNVGSNSGQVLANQALLRGYIGDKFFVAGGVNFGSLINNGLNNDVFLNPSVQAGVTLPVGKGFVFEPYVQLDTPELLNDGNVKSLSANLTTRYSVNESFGLVVDAGVTQSRTNYKFLSSGELRNIPYAFGGVYFNF